jgi:hypothetical protein
MRRALAVPLAAVAYAAAGCGGGHPPLSALCVQGEEPIVQALQRAPGSVALTDGTPLSQCVARARDAGDLQSFGVLVVHVADRLADRAGRDRRAALRLGYLIGAAERGAAHSNGIHAELVHRLEVTARRLPDAASATLERGRRAGQRSG